MNEPRKIKIDKLEIGDIVEVGNKLYKAYEIGDGYALLKEEGHGVDSNRNN